MQPELGFFEWIRAQLYIRGVERNIRKRGWTGVYVPGDAESASLSYSVGFQDSLKLPEVVMFGANPETTNYLLWLAHEQLKSGELRPVDGALWDGDWGPLPRVMWRPVHSTHILREYFNVAILHAEKVGRVRAAIRAWQLVFSDSKGAFPWEADWDVDYRPIQPALYEPYTGPPDEY